MKVCIVGDGLVSLTLAKALVNEEIYVDLFSKKKPHIIDKSRTLGISKANINYFNKNILNINNLTWGINNIEIYSDILKEGKILNFEKNNNTLFSIVENHKLYKLLISSLSKNKFFKKKIFFKDIKTKNYKLILNCDVQSYFTKKYFYKSLIKNYNSRAFISVIEHKELLNNKTAVQFFTKKGPLAFLPISNNKTSIVYSMQGSESVDLKKVIENYNKNYEITKINKIFSFELKAINLRSYYHKNILAFGDILHRVHPLAGQGFNMSIRDIKQLMNLIKLKLKYGLDLDESICREFEKNVKHKNFIFSSGIDLIHEFFILENKLNNQILTKSIRSLGKNKKLNSFFTKIADIGLNI